MNLISRIASPLLILALAIPQGSFADTPEQLKQKLLNSEKTTTQALIRMQHDGTEFYADSQKTRSLDLRDLHFNDHGVMRFYAVTPYDQELKTRVGMVQTLQLSEEGALKITFEILKNDSNQLKSYPIRAIKSIQLGETDSASAKIKMRSSIQAALSIAKNQMGLVQNKPGTFKVLVSKLMESLLPSANANALSTAAGIISTTTAVALTAAGLYMLKLDRKYASGLMKKYSVYKFIAAMLFVSATSMAISITSNSMNKITGRQ